MIGRNITFYRLQRHMTKRQLAEMIGVSPMAITHYEKGNRTPGIDVLSSMAAALQVNVVSLMAEQSSSLVFEHGEFSSSGLEKREKENLRLLMEEFCGRFYEAVELLGGDVLPEIPEVHSLPLMGDIEAEALSLRSFFHTHEYGPVGNLIGLLETRGIIIHAVSWDNKGFHGMNGLVSGRPYILLNDNLSPVDMRLALVHELVHLFFSWPAEMSRIEMEARTRKISEAFFFSSRDAYRELGYRRTGVYRSMAFIADNYGISLSTLVDRAVVLGILSPVQKRNYDKSSGIEGVEPTFQKESVDGLFLSLVLRGVEEEYMTISRGAELLRIPTGEFRARYMGQGF